MSIPKAPYTTLCLLLFTLVTPAAVAATLPQGFVYARDAIPDVIIESRYHSENNFIGRPIDGYVKPRCILTKQAAQALRNVQTELKTFNLGLKIYDAYRPQRAVDHFVRWAQNLGDTTMKARYYPDIAKKDLFKKGYIAKRSGHSRGSTVDLTIIGDNDIELDMRSGFDFFSPRSWPDNPTISSSSRANRMLLQTLMKRHGFTPYSREWWHFSLQKEPFPKTYFNFPVE